MLPIRLQYFAGDPEPPEPRDEEGEPRRETAAPVEAPDAAVSLPAAQEGAAQEAARERPDPLRLRAEELRRQIPGFDLDLELRDPAFGRLVLPPPMGAGIDPETAWFAVHHREIAEAQREHGLELARYAARASARMAADAVASGALRPPENGSGSAAPALSAIDPRTMSREERRSLKDRVRRGERIEF